MHNESFYGGRKLKKPSRKEIQEMITNMRKVEDIKEKSKTYHKKEFEEIEKLLDQIKG